MVTVRVERRGEEKGVIGPVASDVKSTTVAGILGLHEDALRLRPSCNDGGVRAVQGTC